jgi:hypothetical protein
MRPQLILPKQFIEKIAHEGFWVARFDISFKSCGQHIEFMGMMSDFFKYFFMRFISRSSLVCVVYMSWSRTSVTLAAVAKLSTLVE